MGNDHWELPWSPPSKSKTQHYPPARSTQHWMPHSNNKEDSNTNPTISKQTYCPDTPKHSMLQGSAHQTEKTHFHPPECRKKSLSTWTYTSHWNTLIHWGRGQKQELQPYSLGKRYLTHSKLVKMKSQRNMMQMKEQGKTWHDQINEEEICKLPE